jgi:PPOX class probable F420-dependent enzyme
MNDVAGSAARIQAVMTAKTALLETLKRDGTWVPTPVSLVAADGRLYFRSYRQASKAKRLRNFPQVRLAPCTMRGTPTGAAVTGRARLLDGEQEVLVRRLLRRRFPVMHGIAVPLTHRLKGLATQHYEIDLDT